MQRSVKSWKKIKVMYGIENFQDELWEIDAVGSQPALEPQFYKQGFEQSDPLGAFVNSLTEEDRAILLEALVSSGYAAAKVDFELEGEDVTRFWLWRAKSFFDEAIGRNLTGEELGELALLRLGGGAGTRFEPTCEAFQIVCNIIRCFTPRVCQPQTVYGDWQPRGTPCNCTTIGPWSAACADFTANAQGKITIFIPYPPPRGTSVEITVGIGVTVHLCACIWERRCVADSQRTVTKIAADCTQTVTTENGPSMTFSTYGWTTAWPAEQCQSSPHPTSIPPASQPCGL